MKPQHTATIILVLGLGGAMLGGVGRSAERQSSDRLIALTDTQIAASFSGVTVRPRDEELIILSGVDRFCPTGVFWHGRDRVGPVRGAYEIAHGRLCTQAGETRQCRYVFRDADGTVYMSNYRDGERSWPVLFVEQATSCP